MLGYDDPEIKSSHRRLTFVLLSVALAGICSVYPVACFKKYSSKERTKLNRQVDSLECSKREKQKKREENELLDDGVIAPRPVSGHHQPHKRKTAHYDGFYPLSPISAGHQSSHAGRSGQQSRHSRYNSDNVTARDNLSPSHHSSHHHHRRHHRAPDRKGTTTPRTGPWGPVLAPL